MPEHVQLSLLEIGGAAKEGLMALAVSAGLAVLHECMEHEVDQVVGPKGRHDADGPRSAMGTPAARSRSAAGACRSAGRA